MNVSVEYCLSPRAMWLRRLKKYVKLKLYKDHCTLAVNSGLYRYLKVRGDDKFAKLVSLFIVFSGSVIVREKEKNGIGNTIPGSAVETKETEPDKVTLLSVFDIAKMIGVCKNTVKNIIAKHRDEAFQVLTADHVASYHRFAEGKSKYIESNSYQLLERFFNGVPEVSRLDSWYKFKIDYKGLELEYYLLKCYYNIYNSTYSTILPLYRDNNSIQNNDKQLVKRELFNHFNGPVYGPLFDENDTPYPINWPRHPDSKARFIKGRWYLGTIHSTEKGKERMEYLGPMGLTHEIDMHNAMFYFMLALLPDSVSKTDRAMYFELVKSGRLYDDAVDMLTKENREFFTLPLPRWMEGMPVGLSRDEVKERFQRYRNSKGKTKQRIKDIDWYFKQRFPTIREWLLTQKQMQNRLAWIETDFMSRVCEKLSVGNIRYEWLHDAVYVSESDSVRAQEILDSVREEFENTFSQ